MPLALTEQKDLFDVLPENLNWNTTGWLVYDQAKPMPDPAEVAEFDAFDDFTLVPYDKEPLFPEADQVITLDVISMISQYVQIPHTPLLI